MLTAAELKQVLQANSLRLTKRLGQNHLIDPRVIQRVIEACGLTGDETVVEIGAGLGALTEPLAGRCRHVIAIEVDRKISALLAERMAPHRNVRVLHQDILEFSWEAHPGATVVGAIPYHITSPIIAALCDQRAQVARALLIVQEEVAERLAAKPATSAYGRLSVLAQYSWAVTVRCRLPRSAFFPQPNVDSALVELSPHPAPFAAADEAFFFAVVKAAFSQRRKTLLNGLAELPGTDRAAAEAAVAALGLPRAVRGETLSLEQFIGLADRLR